MRRVDAELIHDMRNAAAVIRGAAETLHSTHVTMPSETVEHLTAMLARRSEMLVRLLEDLAIVNELDRGDLSIELQQVVLIETLRDVVTEQRDQFGGGFSCDIAPDAVVLGDPTRIVQIVDNLLSNAVRYGGSQVSLRAWRDGGSVHIAVADDGPGVPAELLPTIFDLYSRGSASSRLGGSGLGLAIVQELCALLGGSIEYRLEEGGACFVATLPALPVLTSPVACDTARKGHSVAFWSDEATLVDKVTRYAASGLAAGEAVAIVMTPSHLLLVERELAARGIDLVAARRLDQFRSIDATQVHNLLRVDGHIDPQRFASVVGDPVVALQSRWQRFRVFGEIVDLYWRAGEGDLAIELEQCWNELRTRVEFPLFCGYELAPDQEQVCNCHESILVA